ncbi:MAG: hypothetical protein MOB07_02575 [Acidobacteria bacterium]|nr:hypothetical protein [Acidobacteriota bacterium]
MNTVVYNIPVNLVSAYRGRDVIVRSQDPAELVGALSEDMFENLIGVQLLDMTADADAMADWGYAIPVDLVMRDPITEFSLLYRHAKLLDKHPLRALIPAVPGFSKAVKIANSLQFVVRLELGQPDPTVIEEMLASLNYYLHHASVSQPIEFFHTTLVSFYDRHPITLWDVQEEDPLYVRYVREDGSETIARRSVGEIVNDDLNSFVANLQETLLAERGECSACEFYENCGGYFKWPRRDYECDGVKTVFRTVRDAASELEHDLKIFSEARTEARR